jgi:hypothetical protein
MSYTSDGPTIYTNLPIQLCVKGKVDDGYIDGARRLWAKVQIDRGGVILQELTFIPLGEPEFDKIKVGDVINLPFSANFSKE